MIKNNKSCIVCSTRYSYCSGCQEFDKYPTWMAIFHDANCKEIYNAASMHGQISNEEIKERLDKCNLSNKANFHKNIQKVIDEIYAVDVTESVKEETPVTVEEFVEVMEETAEESNIEQIEIIETTEVAEAITVEKPVQTYNDKRRKENKDCDVI